MNTAKQTMPEDTMVYEANGITASATKPPSGRKPLAFVCPNCRGTSLWHCSRGIRSELMEIVAVFDDGDFDPGLSEVQEQDHAYYFCEECGKEFSFGFHGDDPQLLAEWMFKGCPAQDEAAHVAKNGTQPERL